MNPQIGQTERPLICVPLVGKHKEDILAQLHTTLKKEPDIIEWRADFFEAIADARAVSDMANQLKIIAKDMPLIFTIRSVHEGGEAISLSEQEVIEVNAEICRHTDFEYVDCELSNKPEHIKYLRCIAGEHGTKIIASFHDFQKTPSPNVLQSKFAAAMEYHLDVAKVAVMPSNLQDVLSLLQVTYEAKQTIAIPIIAISMGKYGALSRLMGGAFGSALTFAVGAEASAPGQIPIEEVKEVLDIIEKSMR